MNNVKNGRVHKIERLSLYFSSFAIIIGLISILGWVLDISFLKAIIPNMIYIRFNAALGLFLCGLASLVYSLKKPRFSFLLKVGFPFVVLLISFLTLCEYIFDVNFGIDELFFKDLDKSILKPGRMSFIAANLLVLTSIHMLIRNLSDRLVVLGRVLVPINLFICILSLLGYSYGAFGLINFFPYQTIAPQTVLALCFINISLLISDKTSPMVSPFLSEKSGGVFGRKLLLLSALTLVAIGYGTRKFTQLGQIDASIDGAIVVSLSLFLLSFYIWKSSVKLNLIDEQLEDKQKSLDLLNQLRTSEQKYRDTIELAGDGIFEADVSGVYTDVNVAGCKMLGYQKDEIIGKTIVNLIPEEDIPKLEHVMRLHLQSDAVVRLEWIFKKKDGTLLPVEISSRLLKDKRLIAFVRDISQRQKTETQQRFLADLGKALDEAPNYEDRVQKLTDFLVAKIADESIVRLIERGELVYKTSSVAAKPGPSFLGWDISEIQFDGVLSAQHAFKTGKMLIVENVQKEILENNSISDEIKDRFRVSGVHSYVIAPLIVRNKVIGTLSLAMTTSKRFFSSVDISFIDIVANRCAIAVENARLYRESHLAQIVANNLPSMIAYWDKNQRCQFANKVYLDWFGIKPEDLVGLTMRDLMGVELYEKNRPYIEAVLNGEAQQFERDLIISRTGEVRHTSAMYIPDIENGEVKGFFVLVVDVTELKKAVKMREEVLAIVSHDLKNPLGSVKLSAELMMKGSKQDISLIDKHCTRILRSINQMQLLIGNLLDFAKMQAGTFSVDLYSENLREIVINVIASFQTIVESKELQLTYRIPEDIENVACDRNRISQVLSNLVGNAVKFTPKGGAITVVAKKIDAEVVVSVSDNGPGIPTEQLKKVFDRFWQAEETRKLGSGLGLSIAKGFVLAHGGTIWVDSELGRGATFSFTLPLATATTTKKHKSFEKNTSKISALKDAKILIVDDSKDSIAVLKIILEEYEAIVYSAENVQEATNKMKENSFVLIITDMQLPDGDGILVLKKARQIFGEKVPVISFSGYSSGTEYERIQKAGFDGHLTKPIDIEVFLSTIKEILSRQIKEISVST